MYPVEKEEIALKEKLKNSYILFSIGFIIIVFVWEWVFLRYNKSHIFNIDGIEQYYATFLYTGDYIRTYCLSILSDPFSIINPPAFDLSIAMGEDIIGSLNYYGFGSPLNLIAVFANRSNGPILFTISYYLRLYLGGIAFIYLLDNLNVGGYSSVIGAICFVINGFTIVGCSRYLEWASALIYLPLIICGAEKIIKKKSWILFTLSVCFAAMCGFYYLYMCSLCLAVYALIRISFRFRKAGQEFLLTIVKLLAFYIWGILIAAVFFIPSMEAFFGSERSGATSIISILTDRINYIPDLEWLVGYYRVTERGEILYSIWLLYLISLIGVVFFIRSNAAKQSALASFIAVFCSTLPLSGWLFNGFGETNLRYTVIIQFTLSVNVAYVLGAFSERIKTYSSLSALVRFFAGATALSSAVYIVLIFYSTLGNNWKTEFISYRDVNDYIDTPPCNYSSAITDDEDVFRIAQEKRTGNHNRPENMAMLNGYYGMTYFLSIINNNTQEYVNKSTGEKLNWRSWGVGDNSALNADCGVKYYLSLLPDAPDDYELADQCLFLDDTWYVYRNTLFRGMAYFSDNERSDRGNVSDIRYDNYQNTFMCNVNLDEKPSVLTVALPYSRNWIAFIDGSRTGITRTPDAMFIDIPVTVGEHSVVLQYRSYSRQIGMVISIMAILALIVFRFSKKR